MKSVRPKFPKGWNEKEIRALIEHYDNQTDEEGAAEIEDAEKVDETWMPVPSVLVPTILRLIEQHRRNGSKASARRSSSSRRLKKRKATA